MFKTTNLKLYRKFLILAVMIGGLFMVASINRVSAIPCCSDCEDARDSCVAACYNPNPGKWNQCVQEECNPPYFACLSHCDISC
jgi:hypothetical protein